MSIRLLLCFFVLLGPVYAIYAEPVTGEELQVLAGRVKAASEAVKEASYELGAVVFCKKDREKKKRPHPLPVRLHYGRTQRHDTE